MTPRMKVMIKSMEKTARMLLIHLTKRDPHNSMNPRIEQHYERMKRSVIEFFDDNDKKRPLEAQPTDGLDTKRQRVGSSISLQIPPLSSGPYSMADLFSLVPGDGLKSFDVSQVPAALVAKINVNTLSSLDGPVLSAAIDGIRSRLHVLATAPAQEINPNTAPLGVDEDDDDYEPDFFQAEDTEQILNKLDGTTGALEAGNLDDNLSLTSFNLPQPPQLTPELALSAGSGTIGRVLDMMKSLDEPTGKKNKAGFNRLAASSGNREAWMTILTRLATRSSAGLEQAPANDEDRSSALQQSLSTNARDIIYNYIMEDFRKHIDVAVSWLCEEWYNDKVQTSSGEGNPKHYEKCTLRLLDGFLPYLHPADKVLTRFLSEIPELNRTILSRVKYMCRDPSVVQLALNSLLYLVLMRPPVKEQALDTVQDIWTECKSSLTCTFFSLAPPILTITLQTKMHAHWRQDT